MHGDLKREDNHLGSLLHDDSNVQYVNGNGNVNYNDYDWNRSVRPFWNGRRKKVNYRLKLEPHYQKSKLPFLLFGTHHNSRINTKEYNMDFQDITNFKVLYDAYKKSKKGKGFNQSRLKFEMTALDGLLQIKQLLDAKTYQISPYNKFYIYEPKERIIEAGSFKDKIVQHSICDNVLLPELKHEFIQTNYAGQIGKGTHYGLNCLKSHMLCAYNNYGYDCWILKADIKKYFYSIQHQLLKDIVQYFVSDQDIWWLCEKFIDSTKNVGLPLGNQITQVFALLFLSGMDHFITGELGIDFYGRYMDDFYLIAEKKSYIKECLYNIQEFVSTLGLDLNSKTQIVPFKNGIRFCGFHVYITKNGKCICKLTNEKKRAANKKYRKMAQLVVCDKLSVDKFIESYKSFTNHLSYGNCVKLKHELDQTVKEILGNIDI